MQKTFTSTTINTRVQLVQDTTITGKKEWYLLIHTNNLQPQNAQVIKIRESEYRKLLKTQQ